MIHLIPEIESFDQKCVIVTGLLLSEMIKQHKVTIGFDQSLSNSVMNEQICLKGISNLYKTAGKCNDQQQYKAITEAAMVSIPEGFTNNSQMSPRKYVTVK